MTPYLNLFIPMNLWKIPPLHRNSPAKCLKFGCKPPPSTGGLASGRSSKSKKPPALVADLGWNRYAGGWLVMNTGFPLLSKTQWEKGKFLISGSVQCFCWNIEWLLTKWVEQYSFAKNNKTVFKQNNFIKLCQSSTQGRLPEQEWYTMLCFSSRIFRSTGLNKVTNRSS